MSFAQEWTSWTGSLSGATATPPSIGSKAPSSSTLTLEPGRPAIIIFLRHAGCPFAEKTYLRAREAAKSHHDITFFAVSHSDESATKNWQQSLPQYGSEPDNLRLVVDDKREAYMAWGLGASSIGHFLSPSALYEVYKVGKEEGIWNRPTESGSRWQQSGFWAVDASGTIKWGRAAESAGDVPDFEEAVSAISA